MLAASVDDEQVGLSYQRIEDFVIDQVLGGSGFGRSEITSEDDLQKIESQLRTPSLYRIWRIHATVSLFYFNAVRAVAT